MLKLASFDDGPTGRTNMAISFPILTFHAVDDRPSIISFSPQLFERGMAQLHDDRYQTLSLLELIEHIQKGLPFPKRCFSITFDDGYQSVYDHAFPILQRYGFSAIVFLTTGENAHGRAAPRLPSLEGRSMLSWHEIDEMHRSGIEFGAHTLTHPDLTRLSPERSEIEICDSQKIIEDALGAAVNCFAYPYGCYDSRCREIVSQHFVCACADRLGLVHSDTDVYAMERVDAYYLRTDRLFSLMSKPLFPFYVKARSIPRRIRRAVQRDSE